MRKAMTYIWLILVCAITCGCDRRDLYDNYGGNIILDIEIVPIDSRNDNDRSENPAGMTASFCDRGTMKAFHTSYLSPTGGFVSLTPDFYHLMVYNYDTEYTLLRNEDIFDKAEAYTNEVPPPVRSAFAKLIHALSNRSESSRAYADDPVIQEPDPLYVGTIRDLVVPASSYDGVVRHIPVKVSNLLERYDFHISVIEGMEYIQTAEIFITGQVQSRLMHDRTTTGVPCTLYVPLKTPRSNFLSGSFLSFGAYPGQPVYLVLRITNLDNKVAVWEWDVSDQVAANSHYIEVETQINIPIPEGNGSGFDPEIDDWENIITDITL